MPQTSTPMPWLSWCFHRAHDTPLSRRQWVAVERAADLAQYHLGIDRDPAIVLAADVLIGAVEA